MPFEPSDLETYLSSSSLNEDARDFIRRASKKLSRDVGRGPFRSVVTEFQSDKMGVTVNTESRRAEFAYAMHLDFDKEVLAYYEQLPEIDCHRTDKNGKTVIRVYRADFAVLSKQECVVVGVKTKKDIDDLIKKHPTDWFERDGKPIDLPAEKAFEKLGLRHQVVSSADMPIIRVANLALLLHLASTTTSTPTTMEDAVEKFLSRRSIIRMADLAAELGMVDLTPILRLILKRKIFADIDHQFLSQPQSCWLSGSEAMLDAAMSFRKHSSPTSALTPQSFEAIPPKLQAEQALQKLKRLTEGAPRRTVTRWTKLIRDRPDLTPFQALVPHTYLSGNRLPKRPEEVLIFAQGTLSKYWADPVRSSPKNAHIQYELDAKEAHPAHPPVTFPTYKKMMEKVRVEAAEARGGRRAANAAANPSDVEDRDFKATRPFERALVDHCLLKLYCVLCRTQEYLFVCRPLLTVLRDAFTGEPLAFWIGFSAKRRAIAMVLRSCLRRHGRLPESVSVDQGSDLTSVYLSMFLAHCRVHLVIRPKGDSRYGSEIERFFGLFKTRWLDMRPGNLTDLSKVRAVSGSHKPENFAAINLPTLFKEFEDFCAWVTSSRIEGWHDTPPSIIRAEGMARFPFSGRPMPYDDVFIIASAVDEKEYSLDPSRGIKVGDEHYWHPALADPSIKRRDLEVRLEPEDHTCIYVRAINSWVTCLSSRNSVLVSADPMYRILESLLVMDGGSVKEAAKKKADAALVQAIRIADARIAGQALELLPPPVEIATPNTDDLWKTIRDAVVDRAPTSHWSAL